MKSRKQFRVNFPSAPFLLLLKSPRLKLEQNLSKIVQDMILDLVLTFQRVLFPLDEGRLCVMLVQEKALQYTKW